MEKKRQTRNVALERALERLESNVVPFVAPRARRARPDPLSDDEIDQLRLMLQQFDKIRRSCPMARRILEDDE